MYNSNANCNTNCSATDRMIIIKNNTLQNTSFSFHICYFEFILPAGMVLSNYKKILKTTRIFYFNLTHCHDLFVRGPSLPRLATFSGLCYATTTIKILTWRSFANSEFSYLFEIWIRSVSILSLQILRCIRFLRSWKMEATV